MSVCGFCLSYTLPWDLGLFCCIPTFVFLNIVCGGNFHLSRQQMWMRTKFSNRCRIRRWPNRLPFYSSNNSGHWASVGYTWYGFTNIIRHQLFVRQYMLTILKYSVTRPYMYLYMLFGWSMMWRCGGTPATTMTWYLTWFICDQLVTLSSWGSSTQNQSGLSLLIFSIIN